MYQLHHFLYWSADAHELHRAVMGADLTEQFVDVTLARTLAFSSTPAQVRDRQFEIC